MMPRSTTCLLLLIAFLDLSWAMPLAFARQVSRFTNVGDAIPAPILQQLEEAHIERK